MQPLDLTAETATGIAPGATEHPLAAADRLAATRAAPRPTWPARRDDLPAPESDSDHPGRADGSQEPAERLRAIWSLELDGRPRPPAPRPLATGLRIPEPAGPIFRRRARAAADAARVRLPLAVRALPPHRPDRGGGRRRASRRSMPIIRISRVQHGRRRGPPRRGGNYLATPRIEKPCEANLFRYLAKQGADGILVRNAGGLYFCRGAIGMPFVADFSLNAANELTVELLQERGGHPGHGLVRPERRAAPRPDRRRAAATGWRS